jgi:transcriptional regulator with GAF, ATPase, and Fis domain
VAVVPRAQTKLTAKQRRDLQRLADKVEKAEEGAAEARKALDHYLRDPAISIPAAARELGLTPQALYQRLQRSK